MSKKKTIKNATKAVKKVSKKDALLQEIATLPLTSQTQRVALALLSANGQWVTKDQLQQTAGKNAADHVRNLRRPERGNIPVEVNRNIKNTKETSFRISENISEEQIEAVFSNARKAKLVQDAIVAVKASSQTKQSSSTPAPSNGGDTRTRKVRKTAVVGT